MDDMHGDIHGLRAQRKAWHASITAVRELREAGHAEEAERLRTYAADLGAVQYFVAVPCIICKKTYEAPVKVGGLTHGEPNAVICGNCDSKPVPRPQQEEEATRG